MKTLRERTEIQQAFLDGAKIEYKQIGSVWQTAGSPAFDWHEKDYQIKPKPMELWLTISSCGQLGNIYRDKVSAKEKLDQDWTAKKFIEVDD